MTPAANTDLLPRTFWSATALAAAVDEAFAEALAEELATALRGTTPAPILLPDTDTLIAQAGIALGPCPPDPRTPSRTGQLLRVGGSLAGRATWWLLKNAALLTGVLLVQTVRVVWHIAVQPPAQPPAPALLPPGRRVAPAEFLEATSTHIQEHGWTQHFLRTEHGECILGAEKSLIRSGTGTRKTAAAANAYLLAVTGARSVSAWNDQLSRTEEQVHAALLAAAARARDSR
ncbi:hypothetical protein ACH4PU_30615 [Streptomyces sp. NPDC021100]|uniref:DUF6197 family protein n=1 Tax=Streptomyces sp. NPDC021100 TaxID=3365114 RepID=UPI0037B64F5B